MNEQQLREKFPLDPKAPKADAPQDLRAKAMDMLIHHTSHLIIAGELPELIVNAMLQFASEVAAEKDREIENLKQRLAELEEELKNALQNLSDAQDYTLQQDNEVKRLKDKIEAYREFYD